MERIQQEIIQEGRSEPLEHKESITRIQLEENLKQEDILWKKKIKSTMVKIGWKKMVFHR